MKLTLGNRIWMFIHWLISLLICLCIAAWLFWPQIVGDYISRMTAPLNVTQIMVIEIAAVAIYVILSMIQLMIIFKRKKKDIKGFITVDKSDSGQVRIAISAIEQMVRQAVVHIEGIHDMKIDVEGLDEAIGIDIAASLQSGANLPTVTMNMKDSIRKFVEVNCGVPVKSVSININAVTKGRKGQTSAPVEAASWMSRPAAEPAFTPQPEPVVPETPVKTIDEVEPIQLHLDHTPQTDSEEAPQTLEEE